MVNLNPKIVAMAKDGTRPKQIAHILGHTQDHVYYEISKARRAGEHIPPFRSFAPDKGSSACTVALPSRLYNLLSDHAERRGRTPAEVVASVLEAALLLEEGSEADA
ncbi:MAG: hypothetical protein OQK05_00110 [Pseudopelagicola sp.]|nr:hypothetical protein [Pseudopelagicola sp.]